MKRDNETRDKWTELPVRWPCGETVGWAGIKGWVNDKDRGLRNGPNKP